MCVDTTRRLYDKGEDELWKKSATGKRKTGRGAGAGKWHKSNEYKFFFVQRSISREVLYSAALFFP